MKSLRMREATGATPPQASHEPSHRSSPRPHHGIGGDLGARGSGGIWDLGARPLRPPSEGGQSERPQRASERSWCRSARSNPDTDGYGAYRQAGFDVLKKRGCRGGSGGSGGLAPGIVRFAGGDPDLAEHARIDQLLRREGRPIPQNDRWTAATAAE